MTLSMKRALDLLNKKGADIEYQEFMFVLTVLRDNAEHNDIYNLLNKVVQEEFAKVQKDNTCEMKIIKDDGIPYYNCLKCNEIYGYNKSFDKKIFNHCPNCGSEIKQWL